MKIRGKNELITKMFFFVVSIQKIQPHMRNCPLSKTGQSCRLSNSKKVNVSKNFTALRNFFAFVRKNKNTDFLYISLKMYKISLGIEKSKFSDHGNLSVFFLFRSPSGQCHLVMLNTTNFSKTSLKLKITITSPKNIDQTLKLN